MQVEAKKKEVKKEQVSYFPPRSTATAFTGPVWHSIFTSGVCMFGDQYVTVPERKKNNHMSV